MNPELLDEALPNVGINALDVGIEKLVATPISELTIGKTRKVLAIEKFAVLQSEYEFVKLDLVSMTSPLLFKMSNT